MDVLLSTVIQLQRNPAPTASTLCEQALVKRADGKYVLTESTQFLNAPEYAAVSGNVIGASTTETPRLLTVVQASTAKTLHKQGICATREVLP